MVRTEFPQSVIEKIGYYVYLLIDPGAKKPFYVGKGTGNRIFANNYPDFIVKLTNKHVVTVESKGIEDPGVPEKNGTSPEMVRGRQPSANRGGIRFCLC